MELPTRSPRVRPHRGRRKVLSKLGTGEAREEGSVESIIPNPFSKLLFSDHPKVYYSSLAKLSYL